MERINLVELLKDCPKGMELDCINYNGVVTFEEIFNCPDYPIKISIKYDNEYFTHTLTKYGQTCKSPYNKCIIFPKGKTTWEGFHRPFKDGDIVFYDNCASIFKEWGDETLFRNYVKVDIDGKHPMLCDRTHSNGKGIKREARFATEEEKQILFDAIKANGYKWNSETKTLEKLPKFKVGDKITNGKTSITIGYIDIDGGYYYEIGRNIANRLFIKNQDEWNLVPNKFNINTLVPFESKVLVRNRHDSVWAPAFWGYYSKEYARSFVVAGGNTFEQCIPYEGNEHLLNSNKDCDEYYKTWGD